MNNKEKDTMSNESCYRVYNIKSEPFKHLNTYQIININMLKQYLEKYKDVTSESFGYSVKSFDPRYHWMTDAQKQEFINETIACIKHISDTLEKLPPDSGSLKFIYSSLIYFIKKIEVPIEQIQYELKDRGL
jgi:hypothetical protein